MTSTFDQTATHLHPVADAQPLQWTNELVQKFWDYQSRSPDAYFTSQFGAQIAGSVLDFIPRHARILDYACGTGALTGHLLRAGLSVAACDLSRDPVLQRIFDDVRRVLTPGGVVVVTTPNDEDLTIETVYCPCCNHTFHRWQHVRSWSAQTLSTRFSSLGFQTVATRTTDFSLRPQDGLLRYWARRLINLVSKRREPHLVGVARMRGVV